MNSLLVSLNNTAGIVVVISLVLAFVIFAIAKFGKTKFEDVKQAVEGNLLDDYPVEEKVDVGETPITKEEEEKEEKVNNFVKEDEVHEPTTQPKDESFLVQGKGSSIINIEIKNILLNTDSKSPKKDALDFCINNGNTAAEAQIIVKNVIKSANLKWDLKTKKFVIQ